jgi:hypothetical protein
MDIRKLLIMSFTLIGFFCGWLLLALSFTVLVLVLCRRNRARQSGRADARHVNPMHNQDVADGQAFSYRS